MLSIMFTISVTGTIVAQSSDFREILATVYSPDYSMLAVGGVEVENGVYSAVLQILDADTRALLIDIAASTSDMYQGDVRSISWSSDGTKIVTTGGLSTIRAFHIWNISTAGYLPGQLLNQQDVPNTPFRVEWRPNSNVIAVLGYDQLQFYNRIGTNLILQDAYPTEGGTNAIEWSPDGSYLAVATNGGGSIRQVSASGTVENRESVPLGTAALDATWSPDGTRVAFSTGRAEGQQDILIYQISTNTLVQTISNTGLLFHIEWSPDGRYIAGVRVENAQRAIDIREVATGTLTVSRPFTGRAASWTIDWNSSSTEVAFGQSDLQPVFVATTSTALITNITASSGRTYQRGTLAVDQLPYTDRTYTFTQVPAALTGQEYIRTANADKALTGANFLTFTLTAPADVYVLWDNRYARPSWLPSSSWTDTGLTVTATDATGSLVRRVYRRSYPAGTVSLSGNGLSQGVMYNVVAARAEHGLP
jgi:WD40 repeat protein